MKKEMNRYKLLNDLELSDEQKMAVLCYLANKYYRLILELGIQDGHSKSYDPLLIEGNVAHSYVFDLEDGGRHHPFRNLDHLETMLDDEILQEIKLWGVNE